jgi:hypothetical protein
VRLVAPAERLVPLQKGKAGYFHGVVAGVAPGARYFYRLDGAKDRPDPASRFQPEDVHGPSQVMATGFAWEDRGWCGLDLRDYVIYELHAGTFTPEGTLAAIIPHLEELPELGITALELMPVAQFPGIRNWGYDGVYPFAVQNSYGGPEALKRLVNACHRQGLAVILDVVYNHLGPVEVAKLAVGRVRITSETTGEAATLNFGALHFGEQNLCTGVQKFKSLEAYVAMVRDVSAGFATGEFPETIHRLDRHFGASSYSLRSLFRDEQRRVLNRIMESSLEGTRFTYRKSYDHHLAFMRFLTDLGIPLPEPLPCTAEFVLNFNLHRAFERGELDPEAIQTLLVEARALKVKLDGVSLEYTLRLTLERLAAGFRETPGDFTCLRQLAAGVSLAKAMPFEVIMWKIQNIYYEMVRTVLPEWRWKAEHGEAEAQDWLAIFLPLGRDLSVKVD